MTSSLILIGGGNMASALVGGLLRRGWASESITVLEPDAGQRERLRRAHEVRVLPDADGAPVDVDAVIWAVKPQVLREAAQALASRWRGALHISIAAGVRAADLSHWLRTDRVVRAMPNTAALVSAGVTGLFGSAALGSADRVLVEQLLACTGQLFWLESDERIDALTAVSGSGPAYVFHFIEGLEAAARSLGFEASLARELALLTAAGAVAQATQASETLSELRQRVTSRGGTTQAALDVLDHADTHASLRRAVNAAYLRAVEMSRELGAMDDRIQD